MEVLKKILPAIRSWPEETRRFLAFVLLGIAALSVFAFFAGSIGNNLANLSLPSEDLSASLKKPELFIPESSAPSPVSGLSESFRSLARFLAGSGEAPAGRKDYLAAFVNGAETTLVRFEQLARQAWEYLFTIK